jgi:hypothetical protein
MNRTIRTSILSLATLAALTSAAAARPRPSSRPVAVEIDQLDGVRDGNRIVIDLEIDPTSWRRLAQREIQPILHIQLGRRGVERAYPLLDPSIHFTMDADSRSDAATIWFSGDGRRSSLASMKLGGVNLYSIDLRLRGTADADDPIDEPAPPPARVDWSSRPEVIQACGASHDTTRCMTAVAQARWNPIAMMKTCGDRMNTYARVSDCIDLAVTAPTDPTDRLNACIDVTNTYDSALRCLASSLRAPYEPRAAIATCRDATRSYDQMLACVDLISLAPRDPSEVVKACSSAARTSDQVLPCIRQALSR